MPRKQPLVPTSIGSYTMKPSGYDPASAAFAKRNKQYAKLMQMYPAVVNKNAPQPGAAPAPAPAATPAAAPKPEGFTYDPATDPANLELQGQHTTETATRSATDLNQKKNILLGFGSQELARKILGNDDPWVNLVSDDPNSPSTLGQNALAYNQGIKSFNETENANNVFFGGGRAQGLVNRAHQHLLDIGNLTTTAQGQLTGIDDATAQFQRDWSQRLFDQNQASYRNFLINRGVVGA